MITVNIGKLFLKAYNAEYDKNYTAKEFFDNVYFELFFNHEKYLQWASNSPFVQGLTSKNGKYVVKEDLKDSNDKAIRFKTKESLDDYIAKEVTTSNKIVDFNTKKSKQGYKIELYKSLDENNRRRRLLEFHNKIETAHKTGNVEASVAIGFPASEEKEYQNYSGLVSNINLQTTIDDIYYSWIGSGLALGVEGGFSLLFNNEKILMKTFEGWKVYRQLLNDPSLQHLAPNKITSWNGQWLNYAYSKYYREQFDFNTLNNSGFFKTTNAGTVINTIKWSQLFFNISRNLPNERSMVSIFSIGEKGKTLGFYPVLFYQARKLIEYYKQLFGENAAIKDANSFEQLYGVDVKRACGFGSIGLQALEPDGLREYFNKNVMPNFTKIKPSIKKNFTNEQILDAQNVATEKDYNKNIIPFRTYKTWLLAMITKNKEEMLDYTSEIAEVFHTCRNEGQNKKEGSTKISNQIKDILSSSSRQKCISLLTELISNENISEAQLKALKEFKDRVHLASNDDFKYLITLIKFDYVYQNRIA